MRIKALLKNVLHNLYLSINRFPVTIFFSSVTAILLIFITWEPGRASAQETLGRVAMVTALGVPLSLCISLAMEKWKFHRVAVYGVFALALVVLAGYYIFLLPDFGMVSVTRYVAVTAALYLTFLSVPYLFTRPGFEIYVIRIISRFLVTFLYSAVLYSGLALTLLTVDLLLGVHVDSNVYTSLFFVLSGIFAPCFFLAGLPAPEQGMEGENYPALLRVLLLYIVLPIILIYTSILYLFFLRSLLLFQWPEVMVSHLVLWYSVFSAGMLFLVYPVSHDSKFAAWFTAWFPRLALPSILVMFAAIGIRIQAYGFTENRYFVVILGLWVFGVMLYYSLARYTRNIVLPVTLALIALLAVSGPWSAYSLSRHSQNARFEALAAEYNMLDGGALQKPDRDITAADRQEFVSILIYFSSSHSLDDVRLLPAGFEFDDMEQLFGFTREEGWRYPDGPAYFGFHSRGEPIDVRGYDYLFGSASLLDSLPNLEGLTVQYLPQGSRLVILRGSEEIYAHDLQSYAEEIARLHDADFPEVPVEDMTFIDENEYLRVKIIFTGIYMNMDDTGEVLLDWADFYLLLSIKDR